MSRQLRLMRIGMAQSGNPTGTISALIVHEHLKSQPIDEVVLSFDEAVKLQAELASAISTAWKIKQRKISND